MGDDSDPNVGLISGCEQLLYTNVDHVVDGVERSGWQTMTQTAGLSDDDASTLYALIDAWHSSGRTRAWYSSTPLRRGTTQRDGPTP